MRLTILGTGSARPVGDSAQSGLLVESGETAMLFDIGSGIARQVEARVGCDEPRRRCSSATSTPTTGSTSGRCATASRGPRTRHGSCRSSCRPAGGRSSTTWPPRSTSGPGSSSRRSTSPSTSPASGSRSGRSRLSRMPSATTCPACSMEITGPAGERVIYAGDMGPSEMVIDLARGAEVLILEATLEDGSDRRRAARPPRHARGDRPRRAVGGPPGPARPLLVGAARRSSASSAPRPGVPVEPGVTGMVVDVEPGVVRMERAEDAGLVPTGRTAAPPPVSAAARSWTRRPRLGDRQDRLAGCRGRADAHARRDGPGHRW